MAGARRMETQMEKSMEKIWKLSLYDYLQLLIDVGVWGAEVSVLGFESRV